MGTGYFVSAEARREQEASEKAWRDEEAAKIEAERRRLAAKIIMATVDKIILVIIRPGPTPEERECYDMAGELRAFVPDLEALAKEIIDVNGGVD